MSFSRDFKFWSRISYGLWRGLAFNRKSSRRNQNPAVTVFGSARLAADHLYCAEAKKLAFELSKRGFTIVTGGGGAIMQAANEGAHLAGGESIGINIDISRENQLNPFVKKGMKSRYFFVRKVLLARQSQAFLVFPGGFGTLDELFEIITLIQTEKTGSHPVILMHSEFWQGFIEWCKTVMIPAGMINERELANLKLVNRSEDAITVLSQHFHK